MHDATHEERCLLLQAGELSPQEARFWQAESAACPGCREFLASLQAASDAAQRAAVAPAAWLDAKVLGHAAPRVVRPRWTRIGLGLAAALAAAALVVLPSLREKPNLSWTNGIEKDLARMDDELADISKEVAVHSETVEFYQDLDHIEAMAKSLKKQKL